MKGLTLFKVVFTGAGILALAMAAWLFQKERAFLATSEEAVGMIIDFQRYERDGQYQYHPVIIFEDRAFKPYQFVAAQASSNLRTGETVTVLYDPEDPNKAHVASFESTWGGTLICGFLGLIFISVGGGLIGWDIYHNRLSRKLQHQGRHVLARITGVEENPSFQINGRNALRVLAEWQDPVSGKTYTFKSRNCQPNSKMSPFYQS
ncbi:DUF3592 domain-containing protein [Hahella sp. SMD15-11]|uniref:DUF3592 domain-containing protein n=1 Tax=Thermohahella caldifontis TaxID=3142973 RepID=A0AB39UV12_9GAMM